MIKWGGGGEGGLIVELQAEYPLSNIKKKKKMNTNTFSTF